MLCPAVSSGTGVVVGVLCCVLLLACRANGQGIPASMPSDLRVEAMVGGVAPWSVTRSLIIEPDGSAFYVATRPGEIGGAPIEKREFSVSTSDIDTLWSEILRTEFFSLNPDYTDEHVQGGSVAALTITAHGRTHNVRIQNVSLARFEELISALNAVVPDDLRLVYTAPSE